MVNPAVNWTPDIAVPSIDRIFTLKYKPGTKASPETDPRLFKGENALHITKDHALLWMLKYEHGGVPPALASQRWTNSNKALEAARTYFDARSIDLIEVRNK